MQRVRDFQACAESISTKRKNQNRAQDFEVGRKKKLQRVRDFQACAEDSPAETQKSE